MITDDTQKKLFLPIAITAIYLFAWLIQTRLFLNWDVSWLIQAAEKLLNGGNFIDDFFSPNPPIILYLYMPPILASKLFPISIIVAFRAYIFLIASISLYMCHLFLKKMYAKNILQQNVFLITLSITYLILPMFQLGQRDHLLFILSMPYLLIVTCRLMNGKISLRSGFTVGLLAGFGFAIKPQFLFTPMLIETFFMFEKKSLFAWMRIEVLTILAIVLITALLTMLVYPDFAFVITPYILKNYYRYVGEPWVTLLTHTTTLYCWIPLIIYMVQYKFSRREKLNTILAIGLLSYILVYLAQHNNFRHHIIPAFSLAILLMTLEFFTCIRQLREQKINYAAMTILVTILFLFMLKATPTLFLTLTFIPIFFFSFFTGIFIACFCLTGKNLITNKTFLNVAFIICAGILAFDLLLDTNWYQYRLLLSVILMFLLFSLVNYFSKTSTLEQSCIALLATLIFVYPALILFQTYNHGADYKKVYLEKLIIFMQSQPANQSIYAITTQANYVTPLIHYVNANSSSRFDCFWMISELTETANAVIANNDDPMFFINMITKDLHNKKPTWIFVDLSKKNTYLANSNKAVHYNFISYLVKNDKFKQEWSHYKPVTFLESNNMLSYPYRLQIYKRLD